jgi:hypothetical protein
MRGSPSFQATFIPNRFTGIDLAGHFLFFSSQILLKFFLILPISGYGHNLSPKGVPMKAILIDGMDVKVVEIAGSCDITRKVFDHFSDKNTSRNEYAGKSIIPVIVGRDSQGPVGYNFQFTPGKVPMIQITGLPQHLGVSFDDISMIADREILAFGIMPDESKAQVENKVEKKGKHRRAS